MTDRGTKRRRGPDAAAGRSGPAATPRAEPDNGLPLVLTMLDVPQPYDEQRAVEVPPPLVRRAPYDLRWTADNHFDRKVGSVVYAGGPKALNAKLEAHWKNWWEDHHALTVATAGWCIYRHWNPNVDGQMPQWIVMELPCLTRDGKRARVRAVTDPAVWRMSSELTIDTRSQALVSLDALTIENEATMGHRGFANRWRAYRRRRDK